MLAGSKVVLRPYGEADIDVVYRVFADLDSWAARSRRPPQPLTLPAFREWYTSALVTVDGAEFVIDVDGRAIGRCGMFGEDALARHAEVGIALLPESRGHGYGSDALNVLVRFAFNARNLHRVHLETLATNTAAVAAYANAGFLQEGLLRQHAFVDGTYVDTVVMGLLRSEWPGAEQSRSAGDLGRA